MLRQADISPDTKVFMYVETPEHQLQLDFYRNIILQKKQIDVPVISQVSDVKAGDVIIISQTQFLSEIQSGFQIDTLQQWDQLGYQIKVKEQR
jgi:hypothetical protein